MSSTVTMDCLYAKAIKYSRTRACRLTCSLNGICWMVCAVYREKSNGDRVLRSEVVEKQCRKQRLTIFARPVVKRDTAMPTIGIPSRNSGKFIDDHRSIMSSAVTHRAQRSSSLVHSFRPKLERWTSVVVRGHDGPCYSSVP